MEPPPPHPCHWLLEFAAWWTAQRGPCLLELMVDFAFFPAHYHFWVQGILEHSVPPQLPTQSRTEVSPVLIGASSFLVSVCQTNVRESPAMH